MSGFSDYQQASDSDSDDPDVEFEPEEFEISSYKFTLTTVGFMPIQKLIKLNQSSSQQEISGQKVWCGSLSVCEFLVGNPELIKDKLIVELGAGTGIIGMVCSRLGAKNIILTDHDEQSLTHMRQDCLTNNVVNSRVARLDWFLPDFVTADLQLDNGDISGGDDDDGDDDELVIVAGDVLYKHSLVEPFFTTVKALFGMKSNSRSCLYLCHVPRAGVEHSEIAAFARGLGLNMASIEADKWRKGSCVDTEYVPTDDVDRARVYKVTPTP